MVYILNFKEEKTQLTFAVPCDLQRATLFESDLAVAKSKKYYTLFISIFICFLLFLKTAYLMKMWG